MSNDFERAVFPGLDSVPDKVLERAYWRRKLPPAFRFYLEMLCRDLMLAQPPNAHSHASIFFEELLLQRDMELSLLPYHTYLDKIKEKNGIVPASAKPTEAVRPPLSPQPDCLRCTRCGRNVPSIPAQPGPYQVERDPGMSQVSYGISDPYHGPGSPCRPPLRVPNCVDGSTRVVALPLTKDPFGKLVHRLCPRREEEELLSARELSILLDY